MTPKAARRLVRSIAYRRKLLEDLPELEAELISYVSAENIRYIAGYEICMDNGRLELLKIEPKDYRQLELPYDD
jgi:hypothetical protein